MVLLDISTDLRTDGGDSMEDIEKLMELASRDTASCLVVVALIAAGAAIICTLINKL